MPITTQERAKDGSLWGWDSGQKDWVPIDEAAQQGSFVGNLGRAALLGSRQIEQGINELIAPSERTDIQGQLLQQQTQSQQQAAPWASALGQVAPDVAAGLAIAPLTGGMSIPGMMLTEGAAGALTGALRPGDFGTRATTAALGAAAGMSGPLVSKAAQVGVGGALRVFDTISGRSLGRIATEVDNVGRGIKAAQDEAAATQNVVPTNVVGRSVGAAETPPGVSRGLTEEEAQTEAAMARTEAVGAGAEGRGTAGFDARLERVMGRGYTPTIGQGTRMFSPARARQAYSEFGPLGNMFEQSARAGNQNMFGQDAARALGDPNFGQAGRIDVDLFANQEARLGQVFQDVEGRLPQLDPKAYLKGMEAMRPQVAGPSGNLAGQRDLLATIERLKQWKGNLTSEEAMSERRVISQKIADYFRNGDTDSGELLMRQLNVFDNLMERTIKANKYKTGLLEKWQTARQQWQILKQLQASGVTTGTGDINPKSLLRNMKKSKASGGFGPGGPAPNTPAGDLYDMAVVMTDAESGFAPTGMRMLLGQASRKGLGAIGTGIGLHQGMGLFD